MRVAIYARYSSDRQNAHSNEDQIRKCRQHAATNKWEVLEDFIFSDDAISGSRSDRQSYQRLMKIVRDAEKTKNRPFDGVLVEDNSRLWRDNAEQATALKVFKSTGIRVLGCDGLDSGSGSGNLLLNIKGAMAEEYLEELAHRTRRGLESAALEGTHTGGRCFGYDNVPLPSSGNSKRRPSKLVVNPEQAETVKRVFQMYADGFSLKGIAKKLNAEKITSPRPSSGRLQQSWCPSSIRVILHNFRYVGIVTFGKMRKHKRSDNKRVNEPGDKAQQVTKEFPEQRIISESLWNRVQARMVQVKSVYGERGLRGGLSRVGNAAGNPYIFSGLLKCALCGGNLVIVSGRGRNHGEPHYGCLMNFNRNTCANNVRIRRDVLETQLLGKLQNEVLREEVIEYTLSRFEEELTKAVRSTSSRMGGLEQKKRKLEKELKNLTRAVASGLDSSTIRSEIVDREREIQTIDSQTVRAKPESVRTQIRDARRFVELSLKDIRKLLGSDSATAKATLSRHMPSIVLKPAVKPDGRKMYQVASSWELLGSGAELHQVCYPDFNGIRNIGCVMARKYYCNWYDIDDLMSAQ